MKARGMALSGRQPHIIYFAVLSACHHDGALHADMVNVMADVLNKSKHCAQFDDIYRRFCEDESGESKMIDKCKLEILLSDVVVLHPWRRYEYGVLCRQDVRDSDGPACEVLSV